MAYFCNMPRLAGCFILAMAAAAASSAPGPSSKEAVLLMSKAEETARSLKGYSFHAIAVRTFGESGGKSFSITETTDLKFLRPNYFEVTSVDSNYGKPTQQICDGKDVYFASEKNYSKSPLAESDLDARWYHNDLFLTLYLASFAKAIEAPFPPTYSMLPDEQQDGETCHVVDAEVGGGYPISYKIYIDGDNIIKRIYHKEGGDRPFVIDMSVSNFQANPALAAADFGFTPGPDLKPYPSLQSGEAPLIAIGKTAPEFSLPTPSGPRLSLAEALAGKKALLLNFWFVHCPPCRAEHPKLDKFFGEMKEKGVGILAIDDQDSAKDVAKYMEGAGLHFPTVLSGPMAAVDPATGRVNYGGPKLPDYASLVPYGVHWCPTNILLDSNGRVVWESDKWDEAGLRAALANLGVQ